MQASRPLCTALKKRKERKKIGIHALYAPQLPQSHFACGRTNQVHNYSANQSGVLLWLWGSQTLSGESCQQSEAKHRVPLNPLNLKKARDTFVSLDSVKQRRSST